MSETETDVNRRIVIDNPTTRELWILIDALRERTDEAVVAHKDAVVLARSAQQAHDISSNNLQAAMKEQQATFATKEHFDAEMRRVTQRIEQLEAVRNRGEGAAWIVKAAWAIIGVAAGLFGSYLIKGGTP